MVQLKGGSRRPFLSSPSLGSVWVGFAETAVSLEMLGEPAPADLDVAVSTGSGAPPHDGVMRAAKKAGS